MPFSSLDLSLDPASDEAVRAGWQALEEHDIPSEARRTSPTHRPHLTLLSAQPVPPDLLRRAADELGPLLPTSLLVRATVVFGRGPFVVAHLIAPPPELRQAVVRLRAHTDDGAWVPHLTLSRKVPVARLSDALRVAESGHPQGVVLDRLRHWDAERRIVTTLA